MSFVVWGKQLVGDCPGQEIGRFVVDLGLPIAFYQSTAIELKIDGVLVPFSIEKES